MFQRVKRLGNDVARAASEAFSGPMTHSEFAKTGKLTAQEFELAGDYLISTCPTWTWEAGDSVKARRMLPPGKQYLITRNVPCLQRASTVEDYSNSVVPDLAEVEGESEGGAWLEAAAAAAGIDADGFEELPPQVARTQEIQVIGEEDDEAAAPTGAAGVEEDILDISNLDIAPEDDDAAALPPPPPAAAGNAGVVHPRTYDLLITYDNYYHVPRFWLVGYGEDHAPLSQSEVMEDVISDYFTHRDRKTVTVEEHPHRVGAGQVVSIHPCQHAAVMHKLSSVVAGEGEEFNVEHYMILFLKLISGVVPTIIYDFSLPAGGY